MRLLHVNTKEIHKFQAAPYPPYAILSHTWGDDDDEVTFQEMTASSLMAGLPQSKVGYNKIERCCARAREDEIDYVWIDTCCIDKTSSAELSEAINSMYTWYENARICYAYLSDIPTSTSVLPLTSDGQFDQNGVFGGSRWLTRGWTLQELLAPPAVEFYAADWTEIGTKASLTSSLAAMTGVDERVLGGHRSVGSCNVAERLSWAADRSTKRVEDTAYSLLGLFGVAMPLLYGEGRRAFLRLQDEIMRTTEDYTMLAWKIVPPPYTGGQHHKMPKNTLSEARGIAAAVDHQRYKGRPPLADSPSAFHIDTADWRDWRYSNLTSYFVTHREHGPDKDLVSLGTLTPDYSPPQMTARGLRAWLPMHRCTPTVFLAFLNCHLHGRLVCTYLLSVGGQGGNIYERVVPTQGPYCFLPEGSQTSFRKRLVYITTPKADTGIGLGASLSPFLESTDVELQVSATSKLAYHCGWDSRRDLAAVGNGTETDSTGQEENDSLAASTSSTLAGMEGITAWIDFVRDDPPIVRCVYDNNYPFLVLLRRDWCAVIFLSDTAHFKTGGESSKQRILPNHGHDLQMAWNTQSHTWNHDALQVVRRILGEMPPPAGRRDRILRHGDGFSVAVAYKRLGSRSVVRLMVTEMEASSSVVERVVL